MTHLCLCAHERSDHRIGVGLEPCTHWCGCTEFRLDPRSLMRDLDEGAA